MDPIITIVALLLLLASGSVAAYFAWKSRAADKTKGLQRVYRLATEMADEGFYVACPVESRDGTVVDWRFADCNEQGAAYFGMQKHEFIGKKFSDFYTAASFKRVLNICARAAEEGYYEEQYEVITDSPLKLKWVHLQAIPSKAGLAVSLRDISSKQQYALEVSRLENEDAITGLPNRKWLANFLPKALKDAKKKLALLFIDLDDFKDVNDTLGHPVGDMLLRATATRLKSVIGVNDRVVRFGGDEFVIVLTEIGSNAEARRMAELVSEILQFPLAPVKNRKSITTSIGVSMFPADGSDMDTLLKSAEIAMYSVKNHGKGHHRFYNPTLYESLKGRVAMEQELVEAVKNDEFILLYEPRMNVATGKLCAMEALVRWRHPQRGIIPPLEFIPLAESTGLILKLGELIIHKAFQQIVQWQGLRLPLVPISINVSAHQFNAGHLSRTLFDAFDKYKISPKLIEIELTESAMLGEQASIIKELAAIRAFGIKLLIDDFGTGYSSLAQLQRLEMDILKVDRAFLNELDRTAEGEIFVKAIISMAHALGMGVIAEGVENKAQLDILRTLSCDEIQGHYLSKPMTPEIMEQLLAKSDSPISGYVPSESYIH